MSIDEKLRANKARFGRKLEQVRNDGDLSQEGRARQLRPVFEEAKATDAKLRGERMSELRTKVHAAEKEAFAAPALRGADRALLTGDAALAKAAAWRANEIGAASVVKKYMDTDEAANRKWAAWAAAFSEVERVEQLGESLGFGDAPLQEPPELRGFREAS